MLSLGLSLTGIPVLGRRGPAYDPDALAFFARLTNQPTDARKKLYSDLIASLKTAGVWAKLDALYILAAADAQAARQNLVANAYNLTALGSPAFAADRGYTGDGVGATIATGITPASSPNLKYTLNNASLLSWVRSDNSGNYCSIGAGSGSFVGSIRPRNSGSLTVITNGIGTVTAIVPTSVGLSAWSRANDATATLYKNGALLSSPANSSTGLAADQFRFLSIGAFTQFSIDQVAAGGIGGALSAPEHAALYSALNTYLTAVGAA